MYITATSVAYYFMRFWATNLKRDDPLEIVTTKHTKHTKMTYREKDPIQVTIQSSALPALRFFRFQVSGLAKFIENFCVFRVVRG